MCSTQAIAKAASLQCLGQEMMLPVDMRGVENVLTLVHFLLAFPTNQINSGFRRFLCP